MKAARLLNILLLLSFLLTSCVPSTEEDAEIKEALDDSFVIGEGAQTEPPAPNCYKDVYEVPRESITRKLDILIIPDTSSSIKEERKKIAEGFDYFIGALPQGVDFNIGVILGHSKNSNKSGKLYKKNSSDPLVLKSSELSLPKIKESLSLKIHKPKTDGYSDGGEMGMASLLNALEGVNLQNLKDNGLLRDDAALAVIFVADEQDICAKAPEGITFKKDPQNGERKSFVKYCIDEEISWKEVTIGGDYTYKITPEILLNKLKEVKGDMPLVVGGVLYDELSTIPTGNEDEIGHGYLETIRLAKGINVDLASGDYRDGLTRLGKLATTSFSAPQSFDLSVNPDPTSIKAFVDDILVAHTYDSLSNKVFLVEERSALSTARIEYCEKESTQLSLTLGLESGIRVNEANISLPVEVSGDNPTTSVSLNGEIIFNSNLSSFSVPLNIIVGLNTIVVSAKDELNQEVSETIELTLNSGPQALLSAIVLEGIAPLLVNFDGSASTDDLPLSSFSLSLNGEILTSADGLFSYTFNTPGTYPVKLIVTDSDGLTSLSTLEIIVKAAPIAPVANFEITKSSDRAPSVVTIDGTSSTDPDSEITNYALTFNGETINQSTPIFSLNLETGGDYSFSLTVTDSQGLTSLKEESFSLLNPLVSPVANLSVSPNSGRVPQVVTLDASASSDADGTISKYDFYVDGALVQSSSSSTYSFNTNISKTYEFKVIVTDNDSLASEAISSATFLPALVAPVASLSASPIEGKVPFEITLNASGSSDADGEIVSYIYSDGENVVRTDSSTMTFTQEIPGTYTYSVEVVDNDGLKDVASVQVVAKPKVTTEESALSAYFKFNMIPKGEDNYDLELIYEGRSFNDKIITEAYYTIAGEIRVDVGRRVLGHVDVIPVRFSPTDEGVDMSLTIIDELGGSETFTHSLNPNNPNPLVFVDAIEYAPNSIVLFSNHFHDPYNQLEDFNAFEIDYGDGTVIQVEDNFFQLTHSYGSSGDYTIKITAEGQNGDTYTTSEALSVTGSPEDFNFPLADFKVEKQEWAPGVRLYVDQSLSPNAPIMTYLWELGDGTTAYGPEVIHFYKAGGNDVTLTAILEDGTQSVVKRETIVMSDAPNIVSNLWCYDIGNLTLECEFDAADKFNDLKTLFVNFDDNAENESFVLSKSVSGGFEVAKFTFTYDNPGTYDIAYLVETGRGEELLKLTQFSVTDTPGNEAPVADLSCFTFFNEVDCQAYGSFDPDGFLTQYRFDFGNGDSIVTDTPQAFYTYPEVGTYTITLTVVDDFGVTSTDSQVVTIVEGGNQFPVPNLTCVSNNINELTCDGRASYDTDGEIVRGIITALETGDSLDTTDISSLVKTFTFESGGAKDIKIQVFDNDGTSSEEVRTFFPQEALAPFVSFNCLSNNIGELSCDATNSSAGSGEIVEYLWDIDGSQYSGVQVVATGITSEFVNVNLSVTNSFGKVGEGFGTYNVSQSSIPVADFECFSQTPLNLFCQNNSSDPKGNTLISTWEVLGVSYSMENLLIENVGTSGEVEVKLTVSNGTNESNTIKLVNIKENSLPVLALNCESKLDFVADCSLEAFDPDGHSYTTKWYVNDVLEEETGLTLRKYTYADTAKIKAVVTDSFGGVSQSESNVTLQKIGLGAQLLCNQTDNFKVSCKSYLSGFKDVTPKWFVNGSFVSDGSEMSYSLEGPSIAQIQMTLETLGRSFSFDDTVEIVTLEPSQIKSNKSLSRVENVGFYGLSDPVEFVIENDNFFLDENGKIKEFNVYLLEDEPVEYELVSSTSNSITLKLPLTEGFNELYIETLDSSGNRVVFEDKIVAGSKSLSLTFKENGAGDVKAFLESDLSKPILDFISNSTSLVIENFPKNVAFFEVGSYPSSKIFHVSSELTAVNMVTQNEVLELNENILDPNNGINGWTTENLIATNLDNETTKNLYGVDSPSVEISQEVSGFFRLKTIAKFDPSKNFQMPFNLLSSDSSSFVYYKAISLNRGVTKRGLLNSESEGTPSVSQSINLTMPNVENNEQVYIEITGHLSVPTTTLYKNIFDFLVEEAYASSSNSRAVLFPLEEVSIGLSNLVLTDGQGHDIGAPLTTFIQGGFPFSYNQWNASKTSRLYRVLLKGELGFSSGEEVIYPVLETCSAENSTECFRDKRFSCFLSIVDDFECEIVFTENELLNLNISKNEIFMRVRLSDQSTPLDLLSRGKLQKFRMLRNASNDNLLGGTDDSIDRYGARDGSSKDPIKRLDDEDGGDEWYAQSHRAILDNIFSTSETIYNGSVSRIRINDISPTGFSSSKGFGHEGHKKGITFDARFVGDVDDPNDIFTQIKKGATGDIDKFKEDARGLVSIIESGNGFVDRILVTNSNLAGLSKTLEKVKVSKKNDSEFLTELSQSCTSENLYPLSYVRHYDGHSNHVDVRLNDVKKNGEIRRYLADPGFPSSVIPEISLTNLKNENDVYNHKMALKKIGNFEAYGFGDSERIGAGKYLIFYKVSSSAEFNEFGETNPEIHQKIKNWQMASDIINESSLFSIEDTGGIVNLSPNLFSTFSKFISMKNIYRMPIDFKFVFLWGDEVRTSCATSSESGSKMIVNVGECSKVTELVNGRDYLTSFYPIDFGQGTISNKCFDRYGVPYNSSLLGVENGWGTGLNDIGELTDYFWLIYSNGDRDVIYSNSEGVTTKCNVIESIIGEVEFINCKSPPPEGQTLINGREVFDMGIMY